MTEHRTRPAPTPWRISPSLAGSTVVHRILDRDGMLVAHMADRRIAPASRMVRRVNAHQALVLALKLAVRMLETPAHAHAHVIETLRATIAHAEAEEQ